jgi:hypothetical protein
MYLSRPKPPIKGGSAAEEEEEEEEEAKKVMMMMHKTSCYILQHSFLAIIRECSR